MEEVIEFVCEGVPRKSSAALFMHLLSNSAEVVSFECTESVAGSNAATSEIVDAAVDASMNLSVMANVRALRIGTLMLPNALVRMVKYDDCFDVDCSFDAAAIKGQVMGLHAAVLDLSERFEVKACFAGLDPAADNDTRLFTDREIGPLKMN